MTRRAVVTLAAVALAAGIFVSEARAAGKCTNSICAEEIAAACAGLSGKDLNACKKSVVSNCMTNPDCSCSDPSLPACGTTTTTTSTTTTTTTSTTATSTTTTIFGTTTSTTTTTTSTTTTIFGTTTTTATTTTTTLCSTVREWGGFGTGPGQFWNAVGVAVSADGQHVYALDLGNNRVQKFDADGTFVAQWGGPGSADGLFQTPADVGVGPGGQVYVVDQLNQRVQEFDGDGRFITKWGGSAGGAFLNPRGLGIDGNGNVYVADPGNDRVRKFDPDGAFLTEWTTFSWFPDQPPAISPRDVAIAGTQWVYVSFIQNPVLQRFLTDGTPVDQPFTNFPTQSSLAVDGLGRVYFGTAPVYRWDPLTAGPPLLAWAGTGNITGLATAPGNLVYMSDYGHRIVELSCPP